MNPLSEILADTNVLPFVFKKSPHGYGYQPLLAKHRTCISFMSVAELQIWAISRNWSPERVSRLNEWLAGFEVIWPDTDLCLEGAAITAEGRRTGKNIAPNNAGIPAMARWYGLPLLTHNTSDIQHIDGLDLIETA